MPCYNYTFSFDKTYPDINQIINKVEKISSLKIITRSNSSGNMFLLENDFLEDDIELVFKPHDNTISLRSYSSRMNYLEGITLNILLKEGGKFKKNLLLPSWTSEVWQNKKWWQRVSKKWWEFWK